MKSNTLAAIVVYLSISSLHAQAVFKHNATPESISGNRTTIKNPATDGRPGAVLIVTADFGQRGPYHAKAIGVVYAGGRWAIYNQDRSRMTENAKFNVLAAPAGTNAFVHTATAATLAGHVTTLDHPGLNDRPNVRPLVSQRLAAGAALNDHAIGVYYSGGRWRIFNQDRVPIAAGTQFNVYAHGQTRQVTASAPSGNWYRFGRPSDDAKADALVFATQLWKGVYNPNVIGVWYSGGWTVFNQNRSSLPRNASFHVLTLSGKRTNVVLTPRTEVAGDLRIEVQPPVKKSPPALRGWVDLHTHPMSHLAFGKKLFHGAPDVGSLIPRGTRGCNGRDRRARSITEALGGCNSTHGGWGLDNTCGDYIRAALINLGLDTEFVHISDNPHGDHHHAGAPEFKYWPHQTSVLHQQMWWEWIKRARDNGLRVMVALAVNNELLAELVNGDEPRDDRRSADLQIDEMKRFVHRHRDFMEIALSSRDVRRIAGAGKLAVILGIEVDNLGNFHTASAVANKANVRAEVERLHAKGVRYVFPIHIADNQFGGSAVYNDLFNYATRYFTGSLYEVTTSVDPFVTFALGNGLDGEGNTKLGKAVRVAARLVPEQRLKTVRKLLRPDPRYSDYVGIPRGHVNARGLTEIGRFAVREMMRLGMMIDLDHMSERSALDTLSEAASAVPGREEYPLNMGHSSIRGPGGSERNAPASIVRRVAAAGGLFGVGTANTDPDAFIRDFNRVWTVMGRKATAIGSDVNGLERLPRPSPGLKSSKFYSGFSKCRTGSRTWDYTTEGVAHYGLMADFLRDVESRPNGRDVVSNLMTSAESFARMWEKCERLSKTISNGSEIPSARPGDVCFIAFGDQGTGGSNPGKNNQFGVARAMTRWQERYPTQFVVGLGDNFYAGLEGAFGVRDCDSRLFKERFEVPYAGMPQTFYMIAGNHDWLGTTPDTLLCYARKQPKWYMPYNWYTFRKGDVEFFAIDTELVLQTYRAPNSLLDTRGREQLRWLEAKLATSDARWKVVYGHNPIFSHGKYKDNAEIQKKILPILARHYVDLYLCGHDHNQQHIVNSGYPGMNFVVSGAGGKGLESLSVTNPKNPRSRLMNGANLNDAVQHGFAYIKVSGSRMDLKLVSANVPNPESADYRITHAATLANRTRKPGVHTLRLQPIVDLVPDRLVKGDREFGGHGPHVTGSVKLGISPTGSRIEALVTFRARETKANWSETTGTWTRYVGEPAPPGMRYVQVLGTTTSSFDEVLRGGGRNEVFEGCDGAQHDIAPKHGGPVWRFRVVGDTGGADISDDKDGRCDTRIVSIDFSPIRVILERIPEESKPSGTVATDDRRGSAGTVRQRSVATERTAGGSKPSGTTPPNERRANSGTARQRSLVTELRMTFETGKDDLRGGKDNVDVTVLFRDGTSQVFRTVNGRQRWKNNTTHVARLRLSRARAPTDIVGVTISTTFRGGLSGDNWNLRSLTVTAYGVGSNESTPMWSRSGAPLKRFSGKEKSFKAVFSRN